MMRYAVAIFLAAAVFFLTSGAVNQTSYADTGNRSLETTDESGSRIRCAQVAEAKAGVVLGYIVPCVIHTIEGTTERMTRESIAWLTPAVYSFITLAVVFFGIRILQGGGQMQSEGILLLLKIGIVIALLELIPTMFVPMFYDVMNESQDIVSNAIGPGNSSIHCDVEKYENPEASRVWAQMDCVLGKLYGVSVGGEVGPDGEKRPNMLLAASIIGFLGGFLFGGSFGVILFLACVGVLWTMFMVILRTVMAFLNGYLYAALLFIVSPLFLPLILMKASTQYFEVWWKGILGSIMLPIVISAYAMFAMLLYDRILFDDGSESGRPALIYKLFDYDLVKQMQGMPRPACNLERAGNPAQRAQGNATETQLYANNPFFRNFANPLLTAANNQCFGMSVPSVQMTAGLDTDDNREAFTRMFYDCVKLLVLALLINMGYNSITGLARRLVGSGGVASSLDARGPIETKFAAIRQSTQLHARHAFDTEDGGSARGAEFVERLGTQLPQAIGTGIISGISRD